MRIDNECIRDILFVIEENSTACSSCYISEKSVEYFRLSGYDIDKLQYHLRYLRMKGLIFNPDEKACSSYDPSPDGHEFLSNVREESNWNKIKSVSSSIGFASLKIISAISKGVATAAINKHLGFSE